VLRLLSEGGFWELGVSDYQHGLRLRMGQPGRPPRVLDFCMGRRPEIWGPVLAAVLRQLADVPEQATAEEVDAVFPWAGERPDLTRHGAALLGAGGNVFVEHPVGG